MAFQLWAVWLPLVLLVGLPPAGSRLTASCGACTFGTNAAGLLTREGAAFLCSCLVLDLEGLEIASIEDGIFAGLAVTDLLLSRNALRRLNDRTFEGLSALEVLKLESNALDELPEHVFVALWATLKKLTLAHNRLAVLQPTLFANMSLLEELDLSGNYIAELPVGFFLSLKPRLRKLSLAVNKLNALQPGAFSGFLALDQLNLSSNAIVDLPLTVFAGSGAQLRSLDLSKNSISVVPANVFAGLSSVQKLYLNHNHIQELSVKIFEGLSCAGISGVSIYLSSNKISSVQGSVFDGIERLQFLDLSWNSIRSIAPNALSGSKFESIKFLYLSENAIAELRSDVFKSLTKCHTLLLGGNQLTEVPAGLFSSMSSLQILSLGNNQIARIPNGAFDSFAGSAREIILANNQLAWLPAGLFTKMTHLRVLILGDNPFQEIAGVVPVGDLKFLNTLASLTILDLHNIDPTVYAGESHCTHIFAPAVRLPNVLRACVNAAPVETTLLKHGECFRPDVKTLWPLGNIENGVARCSNCVFSRHITGSLHTRETSTGACSTCVELDFDKFQTPSFSTSYLRS
jgi:Leucine-rich repeat (LRR) protein